MSEPEHKPQRPETVRVHCPACDGDGYTVVPTLAIIGGVAQTVPRRRTCRWCVNGRRRFDPPVP